MEDEAPCEREIKNLLIDGKLSDFSVLPVLPQYIRRKIGESVNKEEKKKLEHARTLLFSQAEHLLYPKSLNKDYQFRHMSLMTQLSDAEEKWASVLSDFDRQTQSKLEAIVNKHEQELVQFQESCEGPSFINQFNKASSLLLLYRKIQTKFAMIYEFDAAKYFALLAKELLIVETKAANRRAQESALTGYELLVKKQQTEILCAKQNWIRKKTNLEIERNREIKTIQLQIHALEIRQMKEEENQKEKSSSFFSTRQSANSQQSSKLPKLKRNNFSFS